MTKSRKVFIYNAAGSGPLSTEDLSTLFTTSEKIFPSPPDVAMGEFSFNMDGLVDPVFVVPGGSVSLIAYTLKPQMNNIKSRFEDSYSYVGVCAGAFLGTVDAELFVTEHILTKDRKQFIPAARMKSTKESAKAFNIIDDYQAFGAFYPDNSYLNTPRKNFMPYRVTLSFTNTDKELSQLYIAGPAFVPCKGREEKSSSEIVATYVGYKHYNLYGDYATQVDKSLAAIVRRLPTEKHGGKLLAATHIETCVADSQLLTLFKSEGKINAALNRKEHDILVKEQKDAQTSIETLLNETLTLKS